MAGAYDDLPDAWKKALSPQPPTVTTAPPATTTATPPATTATTTQPTDTMWDPGGLRALGHDAATAITGGIYSAGSNVARNLGLTANPLPADAQAAMKAHPYLTDVGQVIGGTAATAPLLLMPAVGGGMLTGAATGAGIGAAQNLLAGNPDESWYRRAGMGALLGGGLGAAGSKVGQWFGAGQALEPDVAKAAQTARAAGIDVGSTNLPSGTVKAMGGAPTYAQAGQIDNAVGDVLGVNVPNWSPDSFSTVQKALGSAVTKAAQSGQVNVQPGGAVDSALTQIQQFANANGVGNRINPLISQIRGQVKNGVISGQSYDNLVGNGSVLHDLVGDDDPFVKQSAQLLDKAMDAGFKASSPDAAYPSWVDARTKYRLLMGVQRAIMPDGHINPTTLYSGIQNRFTDLKGTPVSIDDAVGKMGDLASSVRKLFGGGAVPPQSPPPGLWRSVMAGAGAGSAPAAINALMSGNYANPETYLSPAGLAGILTGAAALGGRALGQAYQRMPGFVNRLIDNSVPAANWLVAPTATVGTEIAPQKQVQP